jgi:hypothetical protein
VQAGEVCGGDRLPFAIFVAHALAWYWHQGRNNGFTTTGNAAMAMQLLVHTLQ